MSQVYANQLLGGEEYPRNPDMKTPPYPANPPPATRGQPNTLYWPAGAPPKDEPTLERRAQYHTIPGHRNMTSFAVFTKNNPPLPQTCHDYEIGVHLERLNKRLASGGKVTIRIQDKPVACNTVAGLQAEFTPRATSTEGKRTALHKVYDFRACKTAADVNMCIPSGTILWMEQPDSQIWKNTPPFKDLDTQMKELKKLPITAEGKQAQIQQLEMEMYESQWKHNQARDWHTFCAIYIKNNLYIYDSAFPNIEDRSYAGGFRFYSILQFRRLASAGYLARWLKDASKVNKKNTNRLNNIYIGGGGNTTGSCRKDTDCFLRNVIIALEKNSKKAEGLRLTEEEVIVDIWSTGCFFAEPEVWRLER